MGKIMSLFPMGGIGGDELNFSVVAYASEDEMPETAAENTIAVITTNEITSWIFDYAEPETPTEGMVWFAVDTSSHIEFNALKENTLKIFLASVKQYVSGAWAEKDAQIYQDGTWNYVIMLLYNVGNEFESLTGGWSGVVQGGNGTETAELKASGLYLNVNYTSGGNPAVAGFTTVNKIDLTGVKTLVLSCNITDPVRYSSFGIATSAGLVEQITSAANSQKTAYIDISGKSGVLTFELDVSNVSSPQYVGFGMGGGVSDSTGEMLVTRIECKK